MATRANRKGEPWPGAVVRYPIAARIAAILPQSLPTVGLSDCYRSMRIPARCRVMSHDVMYDRSHASRPRTVSGSRAMVMADADGRPRARPDRAITSRRSPIVEVRGPALSHIHDSGIKSNESQIGQIK
jgi:hypothetical protein